MIKVKNIDDVVQYQLCTGCGVCASAEPDRYKIEDVTTVGRRPKVLNGAAKESGKAFDICPGHRLAHTYDQDQESLDKSLEAGWGPVLGVWEGYAADEIVRYKGSSGGAATALSIFGLESGKAAHVLHTDSDPEKPYCNKTVTSQSKEEVLSRAGSRYATASPCESFHEISENETVFVGKPCDVAAAHNWEKRNGASSDNEFAIKIGFFCAGVPSTDGNVALLKKQGIDQAQLDSLKYRGEGWPGMWVAKESDGKSAELTYAESWGFLQRFRQWRCYICPDHTGEFADIAVGDPWYREVQPGEAGKSLIVARTQKGLKYIQAAADAGHIILETKQADLLPRSQPNLMQTRGALWARLVILKIFGAAVPNYRNFKTFRFWLSELSGKQKIQSFTGTTKRVFKKSLTRKLGI